MTRYIEDRIKEKQKKDAVIMTAKMRKAAWGELWSHDNRLNSEHWGLLAEKLDLLLEQLLADHGCTKHELDIFEVRTKDSHQNISNP